VWATESGVISSDETSKSADKSEMSDADKWQTSLFGEVHGISIGDITGYPLGT